MARSLLQDRCVIPSFSLAGREGKVFDSYELRRRRNLALFLLSDPLTDLLLRIDEAHEALRSQNAEVVVVCPRCAEEVEKIHLKNRISFRVLSDPDGRVIDKFVARGPGESFAALFITDKFGDLFFQYLAGSPQELPTLEEVGRALMFIESQCPECGGG